MVTVIKAAKVLQATGAPPIEKGIVIVEGDRIVAVGRQGEVSYPVGEGTRTIEAEEVTLLPGLIDCHVHIWGFNDKGYSDHTPEAIAASTVRAMLVLGKLLREGITSLRDCGYPHHGIFALRQAIDAREILGPRLFLCGRAVCATGGHGASISVQVDGADEVRKAVRRELKAGADWIKLMATGGTATPGERTKDVQLTIEEMKAAVDEAKRRGKRVSAHTSCLEGARAVIAAGVDCIEHGIELDGEVIETMLERGIYLVPTLTCTRIEAESDADSGIPDFLRLKAREVYKEQMRSFQKALMRGIKIVAGTDAGPFYLPLGRESLVTELATMVEGGMKPLTAIESATRVAAEMLGVDSNLGTIEKGKLADLILVRGDPSRDIRDLNNVSLVIKGGCVIADLRASC